MRLAAEHQATEAALRASGLTYVLLRNSWYVENYTAQVPAILQRGSLVAPDHATFDFAFSRGLAAGEISQIEHLVNDAIRRNLTRP